MSMNITIRLADERDFSQEVAHYVRLLRCPAAFLEAVQEESQAGGSYAAAFERVEERLEERTGLRHYPKGGYDSFRVTKCRLQKPPDSNKDKNQLSLFS